MTTRSACYHAWSARLERHRIPTLIDYLRTMKTIPSPEQFSLVEPIWHSHLHGLKIELMDYQGMPKLDELKDALILGILKRFKDGGTFVWFIHSIPTRTQVHSILSLVDLVHKLPELETAGWDLSSADLTSKRSIHITNETMCNV